MARYWFGNQPSDFVVAPGDHVELTSTLTGMEAVLAPGVTLWCWDHTTGDRITDLLDEHGNPIAEVTSDSYGRLPRFRGPDGVERMLIGQPPEGDEEKPKHTILTTSYPDIVEGLRTRIAALEADSGGEYTSSAHPLIWTQSDVETRISPHVVANLDGREQTVTHVRAAATVDAGGQVEVTVYTVDLATGTHTARQVLQLTDVAPSATVVPTWTVPDGQGLTVGVDLVAGTATDLTVQVMTK